MKISVCIPTYKRPAFLEVAILSCLKQTYLPFEILIGDDSPDDASAAVVTKLVRENTTPVTIRYYHNNPPLRQAFNVNSLFDKVEGELTMLLHDDDFLLPDALQNLLQCFTDNPGIDVAFGKQYIVSDDGVVDPHESEKLNQLYYRTSEYEGSKIPTLASGILQQFPNDCYLLRSSLIKNIQYQSAAGDACDFDFGLRLSANGRRIYFLNKYTANYRLSKEAISKASNNNAAITSFQLIEQLPLHDSLVKYKDIRLATLAPTALLEAAKQKKIKKAFSIFFSPWHKDKIFTLGGIKRFVSILLLQLT